MPKTATPPEQLKTPITRSDGSVVCRRCGLQLGEIDPDGQYLQAGNIRLFGRYQKYFCVCGKPYNFSERDLAGGHSSGDFGEVTREILNELGRTYNDQYYKHKHNILREHEEEDF
jgi:hypothetical protein